MYKDVECIYQLETIGGEMKACVREKRRGLKKAKVSNNNNTQKNPDKE